MKKILLIDDSATTRAVVRHMLLESGYEIVEAKNGLEGYDQYFKCKPDLVLLDITMPILDGIGCLKKIREADPNVRAIMLTSNANINKISSALMYGARGYLSKPVNMSELIAAVQGALAE